MARFLMLSVLNAMIISAVILSFGVRINISTSYPLGLYQAMDESWVKHDLVMSCLPTDIAKRAVARGYLGLSSECDGHTPVIKRVMAIGGDHVSVDKQLAINGRRIPNTRITKTDAQGRLMTVARGGMTQTGYIWLVSNYSADSFDSRYYGEIAEHYVQYKLEPLWTL